MSTHMALYRKWRPLTFDDVFGQNSITTALSLQVEQGRLSHAYLFTGTRGTGKTSCAKILARAACCESPINGNPCNKCKACLAILDDTALDVTEIDAASNNGVENIRAIREEVSFTPTQLKKRVYIIDEVHMLSAGAFNALLKTLEEPPEYVIFILATTELHKVPATILSRCQRYDFRRIAPEIIAQTLTRIAQNEGLSISDDASAIIARLGDGSMRDAISLLDRCASQKGEITADSVAKSLGIATTQMVLELMHAIIASDTAKALELFSSAYLDGRDVMSIFDELLSLVRDIYIIKATGDARYLMSTCAYDGKSLKALSDACSGELLAFFTATLGELLSRITRTAVRRTDGEVCLIKLCLRQQNAPISAPKTQAAQPAAAARAQDDAPKGAAAVKAEPSAPPSVQNTTPKPQAAPKRTEVAATAAGADSSIAQPFLAAVSGKVNSAVRTYLSLSQITLENGVINIIVPEESIGFISKPIVLEILTQEAKTLGASSVSVRSDAQTRSASSPIDDILNKAKQLGIKIE